MAEGATMAIEDPYHEGEVRVQELAGERDIALLNAALTEDRIVAPAFRFLSQRRFLVLGQATPEHACEGTVVFGPEGFLGAEHDGRVLTVALGPADARHADPVLGALDRGRRVGALAIDLATRRRLRINGHVRAIDADRLSIDVDESYPNCPKYIQKRVVEIEDTSVTPSEERVLHGSDLGDEQRAIVREADTFFVVSVNPHGNADASHRGGVPGFVRLAADGALRIPDYAGNSMFNTLGNVAVNPCTALVFWDFERSRLLHLAGRAALELDGHDPHGDTGGTGRHWTFHVERWRERAVRLPFRMRLVDRSPFNPSPAR